VFLGADLSVLCGNRGACFESAMLLALLARCWGKRRLDHGGMREQRE